MQLLTPNTVISITTYSHGLQTCCYKSCTRFSGLHILFLCIGNHTRCFWASIYWYYSRPEQLPGVSNSCFSHKAISSQLSSFSLPNIELCLNWAHWILVVAVKFETVLRYLFRFIWTISVSSTFLTVVSLCFASCLFRSWEELDRNYIASNKDSF